MGKCGPIGMSLSLVATIGILYCVSSRYWKINSQVSSPNVNRGLASYEGLWVRCVSYIPGTFQCDRFDTSYLGLSGALNAQRAMMVIAAIFSAAALTAGCLGLDCIHALSDREKVLSSRGAAVLVLLSGLLTLASVSWYAAEVYREFAFDQVNDSSFSYQFGTALFIGWIASGLALIGAVLLAFCNRMDDDDDSYSPRYKAGGPPSARSEYI